MSDYDDVKKPWPLRAPGPPRTPQVPQEPEPTDLKKHKNQVDYEPGYGHGV